MDAKLKLVDLFCGAGGISHGFEQAGFHTLAGVDFDFDCIETFKVNHKDSIGILADLSKDADITPEKLSDIIKIRPGELDCLAGGPPCQGFSKNRARRHQEGVYIDDPRNELYQFYFRYVEYFRPRFVLMENVPEMLIKKDGHFQEAIFEMFDKLGYSVDCGILNATEYGVPQARRRAFFLAARDGVKIQLPQPTSQQGARAGRRTPTSKEIIIPKKRKVTQKDLSLFDDVEKMLPVGPTVWDAIGDLSGSYASALDDPSVYAKPPSTEYQKYMRNKGMVVMNHFAWPLSERQLQRIRLLKEGEGVAHLPEELRTKDAYGSAYRRLQSDAQALTITTWMFHPGSGMFTHPFDDRVITIREAARIQSFKDDFMFTGRYHSKCKQVGNAVAPLVAKNIAEVIRKAA